MIRAVFRSQRDLLGNTVSLLGTTVTTAVLGVGYWWVAARFLSSDSIGYGSAAISAITLIGTLGMFGFGTLLMERLAFGHAGQGNLVSAGVLTAAGASAVLGLGYAVLVPHLASHYAPYTSTVPEIFLFALAVSLTGASLVLDNALIGLFLGRVQLERNLAFGLLKLVVLAGVASLAPDGHGVGIIVSWSLGIALSFAVVALTLQRRGRRIAHFPRIQGTDRLFSSALKHHWLNLATFGPRTALPLVVIAVLSAGLSGAFYPAWLVATTVYILPGHLSTSLFAVGSSRPLLFRAKTRFSLTVAAAIGIPLSLVIAAAAHPILDIFGGAYAAKSTHALQLLMIGYAPNIVRFHYVSVQRVRERVNVAATMMSVFGLLELSAAVVGARADALTGMAAALTGAMCLEALITAPAVIGVVRTRG